MAFSERAGARRRRRVRSGLGALLLAASALPACDPAADPGPDALPAPLLPPREPERGAPRDLVLVTLDTTRADRLGCYGDGRGLTPNLDRVAREGTRFTAAMAPMPCTSPSHASLLTGLSPRLHGVTSNFVRASDALQTLAERLQAEGFATAAFYNAFDFSQANLVLGFDLHALDGGRRAGQIVPAFARWLALSAGRRRFAWLHLFIPHAPLDLPPEYASRVARAYDGPLRDDFETLERLRTGELAHDEAFEEWYRERYDAAVAFADARVGELLGELERDGSLDSTLLVVLSDHGEGLERGALGLHSPVLTEATLRQLMLLRGPGVPAARAIEALVQPMDVVPTVMRALGFAIPSDVEGRDLGPLLASDEPAPPEWDRAAIATLPTHFEGKRAVDPEAAAIRRGRWKLLLHQDGSRRLHDLEADPLEATDLAAAMPEAVRALEAAFARWAESTGAAVAGEAVGAAMAAQLRKLGYQ